MFHLFSAEYEYDEANGTLKLWENKHFYLLVMESRAYMLPTQITKYDRALNTNIYSMHSQQILDWYLSNKKVIMTERKKMQTDQGTPKKKKIVPKLMVVPDDF